MAIPMRRAKRRAQRARRRSHQHAPRAGVVVRLRPNFARFRRQLRRAGVSLRAAANAMHRMGGVGVATATALQGLHTAIDRANRRDRLAARIADTSLLSVREALDLVAECEPRQLIHPELYGLRRPPGHAQPLTP